MLYIINISRFALGLIFLYSFVSKAQDIAGFELTIKSFRLLPSSLYRPTAISFMLCEALIVVVALLGGNWLFLCYGLAISLLSLFTYALNSVLQRKIQTTCNCFGTSEQKVSPYDIWRNSGIMLIAVLGLISLILNTQPSNTDILGWFLSGVIAFVLSLLLLNLRELLELAI